VHIADDDHAITRGLEDFTITDETYDFRDVEGTDSQVLLTVQHPNSMSTQAWTRSYRQVRVFNFVLGHDNQAYANDMFRTVLQRGIQWCAGSID
jgi:type 1 glutamine amidotransferase